MKSKFFGFVSLFAVALLLTPTFSSADNTDLKNYLRDEMPKVLDEQVTKLVDSLHQSFVGVGIGFINGEFGKGGQAMAVGFVEKVIARSPAAKAGVRENDIIVSVNGKPFNSGDEFKKEVLGDGKPGRVVVLELLDGGNPLNMVKRTVQMETILFGVKDKDKSAVLENLIKKEGAELVAMVWQVSQSIIQKMEADPNYNPNNNKSDRRIFYEANDKFNLWLDKKEKEIEELKAPE